MLHERRSYFILYGPAVQLYKRTYLAQKKYKPFNDHTLLYPESATVLYCLPNSKLTLTDMSITLALRPPPSQRRQPDIRPLTTSPLCFALQSLSAAM
jgi:hypothetical protein